jgi:hypothetical protein
LSSKVEAGRSSGQKASDPPSLCAWKWMGGTKIKIRRKTRKTGKKETVKFPDSSECEKQYYVWMTVDN